MGKPVGSSSPRRGEHWGGRRSEFSPPGGGRCRGATEGGRVSAGRRWAQDGGTHIRRRCARTPLCLRQLLPKGGENGEAVGSCSPRREEPWEGAAASRPRGENIGAGGVRNFLPPAGGEVAERQRGAGGRRGAVGAPVGAARAPPLCLRHLPPKGGEKIGNCGSSSPRRGNWGRRRSSEGGEDVGGERGLGAGEGGAEAVDCDGYGFAGVEYGAAGD